MVSKKTLYNLQIKYPSPRHPSFSIFDTPQFFSINSFEFLRVIFSGTCIFSDKRSNFFVFSFVILKIELNTFYLSNQSSKILVTR